MNDSYLVTGGAGFIGSQLVDYLAETGYEVIVLDNFSSGSTDNLRVYPAGKVEVVKGDIRDTHLLQKIVPKVSGIFHLAGLVSVPLSIKDPALSFDINLYGTKTILNAAKSSNKKVVIASSAAVYGNNENVPLSENIKLKPLSPYGLDKLGGEELGEMYAALYGMDIVALRLFNVYGPRQDPKSPYSGVISIFVDCLQRGESPIIFGDGEQIRDFIYVTDVVRAMLLSMLAKTPGFQVYNVARGEGISINQILDVLVEYFGNEVYTTYSRKRAGDIRLSVADISRIKQDLKFLPEVEIREGLQKTSIWAIGQANTG